MRVFDTINWWNWNHLLDLQLQKLRIGLPWSCIESYCLVKDRQHEKIKIKLEAQYIGNLNKPITM